MAPSESRAWTGRDAAFAAAAAVAAVIAYLPALGVSFTADDFFILARVRDLGGLSHPLVYFGIGFFEYYRPLAFLSQALDWQLWGMNAAGFHLTNVVLHATTSALVFGVARRLIDRTSALVGALLFALHPASHEAVYWIASRFDLLATCFTLAALICLWRDDVRWYWSGTVCFALALLSKESALSLPVIATASDVILAGRDWKSAARRLVPLLLIVGAYGVLRTQGLDVSVAGGARRLPKLGMIVAALGGLLWLASARERVSTSLRKARELASTAVPSIAVTGALAALLWLPLTRAWTREKLGFVAFVAYHSVSPVVLPPPPPYFLNETTLIYAIAGLVVVALLTAGLRVIAQVAAEPRGLFLLVFIVAALIPVSSMTGGARYLYLASVGVSILGGLAFAAARASARWRSLAAPAAILLLAVSAEQMVAASRAWTWASGMTREGLALMTSDLAPCGTRDVVLLTAPVGIRGTYCNFLWEGFGLTSPCAPATFRTLLRVVREDVEVAVTPAGGGRLELRIPRYRGNVLASTDLSTFPVWVARGRTTGVTTPIGTVGARPDGDAEVFRIQLDPALADARLYYYSAGRIHAVASVR